MACPICAWSPDNADYAFLFETAYWRMILAPNQCYLGRCIVHLKRHAGDLADLTPDEMLEFLGVIRQVEGALRDAFGAAMFNWSCYMNLSYRETPPDPHVHWWAVPRYDHPVEIDGVLFEDPQFGSPYSHDRRQDVSPATRAKIVGRIRERFDLGGQGRSD